MNRLSFLGLLCLLVSAGGCAGSRKDYTAPHTADFELTGAGTSEAWEKAHWAPLTVLRGPSTYETRFKVLWSDKGIYVLFDCADQKLTAPHAKDFDDLFNADVVEAFFWPDEGQPIYLEYEISPRGPHLPILVVNNDHGFTGWTPWHDEGKRSIRRATAVRGGAKENGANVAGWSAEVFIPFELISMLNHVPPKPGSRWRANFYRIDYDAPEPTFWNFSPLRAVSYHRFREFGTLLFEKARD